MKWPGAILTTLTIMCVPVLWYVVAADYGNTMLAGVYLARGTDDTYIVHLHADGSFAEDVSDNRRTIRILGTFRRIGEGGIVFSKGFVHPKRGVPSHSGEVYGEEKKTLTLFPYFTVDEDRVVFHRKYF